MRAGGLKDGVELGWSGERGNGPWRWAVGFGPKGEGKAGLLGWFAGPGEEGKAGPVWEKGWA